MGSFLNKEDEVLDYQIKIFLLEFNNQKDFKLTRRKEVLDVINRYKKDIEKYTKIDQLQAEIYELQKDLSTSQHCSTMLQICVANDQRIILNQKILICKKNIPIRIDHKNSYLLIDVFRKVSQIRYANLLPEIIDYIISIYKEIVLNRIISIDFDVMKNIINIIRVLSP